MHPSGSLFGRGCGCIFVFINLYICCICCCCCCCFVFFCCCGCCCSCLMNKANLVPLERAGLGSDDFVPAWILMRSQLSGVQRSEIVMHDVHYNSEKHPGDFEVVGWGLLIEFGYLPMPGFVARAKAPPNPKVTNPYKPTRPKPIATHHLVAS